MWLLGDSEVGTNGYVEYLVLIRFYKYIIVVFDPIDHFTTSHLTI